MIDKNIIRKEIRTLRENLSKIEKEKFEKIILEKFFNLKELQESKVVMSYMDFKNEVSTYEINKSFLESKKRVLIPKISDDKSEIYPVIFSDEMNLNSFGIYESNERYYGEDIDIVIVPGIVFNLRGYRIGFGKGYYDKFLSGRKEKNILKISLAYDFQIDDRFIEEKHDIPIDILITDKRIIRF